MEGQDILLLNAGSKKSNVLHARKWDTSVKSVDQKGKARKPVGFMTTQPKLQTTHQVEHAEDDEVYRINNTTQKGETPITVRVHINGVGVEMEIDTGASITIMSEDTYRKLWPNINESLRPTHVKLETYTGQQIRVKGSKMVQVQYGDQSKKLSLVVVSGSGPTQLGRDWLKEIRLDWRVICKVEYHKSLEEVLKRHEEVFREELGTYTGDQVKILVDTKECPRYCKARTVPFALRDKVETELHRLQELGIIEPVTHADWAAPVVAVLKKDKETVRLCGDYKLTVNRAVKLDRYRIPRIEDIFTKMTGCTVFSTLDMSQHISS